MHWLQAQEDGTINLSALRLDIVGFLAILGEGSVLANVQVSTLSKWIFLPRLIPAPQALMRPTRPTELESVRGYVSGVWSGNDRDNVNHVGNIVCDANKLPRHAVRVVEIRRKPNAVNKPLKAKTFAPLTIVGLVGFALSAMLLGLSIHLRDGMSLVATVLLSLLSSLTGLGNFWTLQLPKRDHKEKRHIWHKDGQAGKKENPIKPTDSPKDDTCDKVDYVPPGNVVIRYPKGSFLIVRCHENVARELYFAPEEIDYLLKAAPVYRLLSLVGTVMLMGGVICLANARIESQIAWAGSYMLLGSLYWIVAALPGKLHWDTSGYEVIPEALSDSDMDKKGYPSVVSQTFTQALWRAIVVSKDTTWVRRSNACPGTKTWDDWLHMARACSREARDFKQEHNGKLVTTWEIPKWDPQAYFKELLEAEAKGRATHQMATHV